jgi:hypothetical protein
MPKAKTKATVAVVRWWVSGGEEECPHCGQLYAFEVEFRCPECDRPCCPHCKSTHADKHIVCQECVGTSPAAEEVANG